LNVGIQVFSLLASIPDYRLDIRSKKLTLKISALYMKLKLQQYIPGDSELLNGEGDRREKDGDSDEKIKTVIELEIKR
jgi:hypothetical protein